MRGGKLLSIYPDESECIRILRDAGCKRRVIVHCCTVRTVAEEFMKKIDCNRELVVAGSMLHDLGRSRDHSILHAMIGASMAQDMGLPNDLVNVIRKHTGAGLDDQDVLELGLPPGDYIPRTIEEKIVAHSDNLVSDNTVVPHTHSVEKLIMKGSVRGARRIEDLHKELSALYGEDADIIVSILGEHPKIVGPCGSVISS